MKVGWEDEASDSVCGERGGSGYPDEECEADEEVVEGSESMVVKGWDIRILGRLRSAWCAG